MAVVTQDASTGPLGGGQRNGLLRGKSVASHGLTQGHHGEGTQRRMDRLRSAVIVCKLKPTKCIRRCLATTRCTRPLCSHTIVEPSIEHGSRFGTVMVVRTFTEETVDLEAVSHALHCIHPSCRGPPVRCTSERPDGLASVSVEQSQTRGSCLRAVSTRSQLRLIPFPTLPYASYVGSIRGVMAVTTCPTRLGAIGGIGDPSVVNGVVEAFPFARVPLPRVFPSKFTNVSRGMTPGANHSTVASCSSIRCGI